MFGARSQDQVHELRGAPQSSVGAPMPVVLADERRVLVVYLTQEHDPDWDGTTVRGVDADTVGEVAIAHFDGVWAAQFGAPNDEAIGSV